jgi:hypothetical protein
MFKNGGIDLAAVLVDKVCSISLYSLLPCCSLNIDNITSILSRFYIQKRHHNAQQGYTELRESIYNYSIDSVITQFIGKPLCSNNIHVAITRRAYTRVNLRSIVLLSGTLIPSLSSTLARRPIGLRLVSFWGRDLLVKTSNISPSQLRSNLLNLNVTFASALLRPSHYT